MKSTLLRTTAAVAVAAFGVALGAASAIAQTAPAAPAAPAWKYKSKHLGKAEIDALLATPGKVLFIDVRRPDELIKYGSFPAFLNIQYKELDKQLAYLPKDRGILTVSNHAQRAGAAGDALAAKGYKVVGATGSEDYENEGGKVVVHIQPPAPAASAAR